MKSSTLTINNNGTQRMTINSNGNVGIGTKTSVNIRIGDTTIDEEDLKRMKLAAAFLDWVEGSDTELGHQWVAFKAFKRITK